MGDDIYSIHSKVYDDKFIKKKIYATIDLPEIDLNGSKRFIITPQFEYRPDLVSYKAYGTTVFEDVVTIANKMTDPIKDYYVGRTIILPSINECARVMGITV